MSGHSHRGRLVASVAKAPTITGCKLGQPAVRREVAWQGARPQRAARALRQWLLPVCPGKLCVVLLLLRRGVGAWAKVGALCLQIALTGVCSS